MTKYGSSSTAFLFALFGFTGGRFPFFGIPVTRFMFFVIPFVILSVIFVIFVVVLTFFQHAMNLVAYFLPRHLYDLGQLVSCSCRPHIDGSS